MQVNPQSLKLWLRESWTKSLNTHCSFQSLNEELTLCIGQWGGRTHGCSNQQLEGCLQTWVAAVTVIRHCHPCWESFDTSLLDPPQPTEPLLWFIFFIPPMQTIDCSCIILLIFSTGC